ncbi:MAG: hypothetical protein ACI9SJ_002073 [Flavobacteriaceae bacterium]|jgi:hypothetical protein|uniref:hypothetical protein n=1 Tax=Candidatus Marifrigoribacter sp. Uisw_064 TaxID=3230970 RepID=UPI003AEED943
MKKWLVYMLCVIGFSSCRYFETEKISKESFLEEELKSITWNEIDQYPVFLACENLIEKAAQKTCFESNLTRHLYQAIPSEEIKVTDDINDTVKVYFSINNQAELSIIEIKMDPITKAHLPLLETWFLESIKDLSLIAPAYKRGIPVETNFILPVIIQTKN